jgi:ketosteroid isomerase-like protein
MLRSGRARVNKAKEVAMTGTNIIDRFFGTMENCDIATLRDCLTEDAIVWHGYDRIAMHVEDVVKAWEAMASNFTQCGITDVRRLPTPSGYVQQHLFVVSLKDGTRKAWPVCIVVQIRNGKIARIDEYIDVSEAFDPGKGEVVTPGL